MPQYRPQTTGNHVTDEALRVVFDNLYELRNGAKPDKPTKPEKPSGDLEAQVKRATALAVAKVGPGRGTYTVGLKLTGGGQNGTITIDDQGRVVAIQQAT
mgnify:CR=1 FL=1